MAKLGKNRSAGDMTDLKIESDNMYKFKIKSNNFLHEEISGFFNRYYTGFGNKDNPDFINILKNTFSDCYVGRLNSAKKTVTDIIVKDIPVIIDAYGLKNCIMVVIPRAKALESYTPEQLYFRDAVSNAAHMVPGVEDGTGCIVRHTNTRTTHLRENVGRVTRNGKVDRNDGRLPYPGITKETCTINKSLIKGKTVILVEDIYTKNCNIDEDCIQALLDNGADEVVFYAIAYTRRNV